MATKKETPVKIMVLDRSSLVSAYMDYVLEHEKKPPSIYSFCKHKNFKESDFYNFFGNIEALEKGIWEDFFKHTMSALKNNEDFNTANSREKMLGFFFSFFELLTLNRSYVVYVLKAHQTTMNNLEPLKGLRKHFKSFTTDLIDLDNSSKASKLTQFPPSVFSEAAWIQLLFTIKFWMEDGSANFEKTDVLIEKSINTVFEVFDNTPLEQVFDLGKFLFKERMA
jgi:hypothetical protein